MMVIIWEAVAVVDIVVVEQDIGVMDKDMLVVEAVAVVLLGLFHQPLMIQKD
tara:strand:+ start:408 stop:563 length:156 start_codon:yes stop_codon:yes gene_type:complete